MPKENRLNSTLAKTQARTDYQRLFEALPARYAVFRADDPQFTIVGMSDEYAQISHLDRSELLGKPALNIFPAHLDEAKKDVPKKLTASLRQVSRTYKPDVMETLRYDVACPDGTTEEHYWRTTHYPVFEEDELALIYEVAEDVTEEVKMGDKLELTKRQLDEALSIGMIGTWVWDVSSDQVVANKNLASMFNIPQEEAVKGIPLSAFNEAIHPDDRIRVEKAIRHTIKTKQPFELEYRTHAQDGTMRWVLARGQIDTDETGKRTTFPGVLVDITGRKLVENNLSYLAKASNVLASSLDYTKTLQTIAKLMVPDIADWCGIELLSEEGQLEQVAVAHKDPAKVAWAKELRKRQGPPPLDSPTGVPKVLRTGKPEFYPDIPDDLLVKVAKDEQELELVRSIGFSSVIIVPLKVQKQTVGAITLVSAEQKRHYTPRDLEMAEELASRASLAITNASLYKASQNELKHRKLLEEELQTANRELENRVRKRTLELEKLNTELQRSNRELEDFAYVASHDMQEPLRKIQAFSNLLTAEYADKLGNGKDYLDRMHKAAARMSTLIEDLLAFSRVTTKGQAFSQVDLQKVVHEVVGDLQTRVEETNGKVTIKHLPTIDADPMQMRQLFQNLIANALKFHKADVPPIVTISTVTDASKKSIVPSCTIEVTDNGVGFDEKYLDRIFAVFQRLHGRDAYEGTGIGLAVCRKITERHGGIITAHSSPGAGSSFIIKLPLQHKGVQGHDER